MRSTTLQKVVLARRRQVKLTGQVSPGSIFSGLRQLDPDALVSLLASPTDGTWLGASPEVLLNVDPSGTLTTVSLAGTQSADPDQDVTSVAWTQKEIEEQAMVSRYIIDCFKKFDYVSSQNEVHELSALDHLCTYAQSMKLTVDTQIREPSIAAIKPSASDFGRLWNAGRCSSCIYCRTRNS